ncbi:hypothetical protein Tco_0992944 [Tanacetum coccineum]|uniref:Uncharacterized protein n=1 Tax=Tanacetum coccineum TaxID=301880 RepID=A0ABQ5F3Y3_9ASTR
MSSGSQSVGYPVVPKFDMHIYTSVLTADEVNSLVQEYAIPLDLRPSVPPSTLTMNNLSGDKIALSRTYLPTSSTRVTGSPSNVVREKEAVTKNFNEFCTSLKHWKNRFFLIDRRAIPNAMPWRHKNSSVADPPPTGVRADDIRRLCENMIDLHPVHPAMLYEIGLTTIWKHVGQHPVFKDGDGNGNVVVLRSQIPEKTDSQKVVEHEDERVLVAQRKAQAAKDKAAGKRSAAEGTSRRTKKKKIVPMSFALSESELDDSTRSGSGTHHSASPLNTIIPNDTEPTAVGNILVLESVNRLKVDTEHDLDNVGNDVETNSPHSASLLHSEQSLSSQHFVHSDEDTRTRSDGDGAYHDGRGVRVRSSSSGGSARQAFPQRNPGGDGIGSSIRVDVAPTDPFVPAWGLTTQFILNDVESCRDMMINLATPVVRDQQNRLSDYQALHRAWFELGRRALAQIDILQRYEALNDDYGELYQSHRFCQDVSDRLTETQNQLVEAIRSRKKERDDLLDNSRAQEDRIKNLEEALASKTSSLSEAENVVGILEGDLEPFDCGSKPCGDRYAQLSIAAGWLEGVKVERSTKDAEAILAVATDYDPECKSTFMSAFDAIFTKTYPYVEKVVESFRLPLGDLQNMWPEGEGPTVGSSAANAL